MEDKKKKIHPSGAISRKNTKSREQTEKEVAEIEAMVKKLREGKING